MWFWWFLFICDCLTPLLMIILGRIMWKNTPKQINGLMGYRTKRSMKNMDTWKFAHEYVGKLWWRIGLVLSAPTILVHVPFYGADKDTIGMVSLIVITVQLVFLLGSIYSTEMALKKNFDEFGFRK